MEVLSHFHVPLFWTGDGVLSSTSGSLPPAFWNRLRAGVCELGIGQDDWAKGRDRLKGVGVRLWCETHQDVDELAERARAWGSRLTEEAEDKPWGVRAFSLDDPDGYHLTFYREIGG